MSTYQTITPERLAQAAIPASITTVYTVGALERAMVKNIDITNTTGGSITVDIHIVPDGGSATTSNALFYQFDVAANSVVQWEGVQVLNPLDTLRVNASATGLTIHASGGVAR